MLDTTRMLSIVFLSFVGGALLASMMFKKKSIGNALSKMRRKNPAATPDTPPETPSETGTATETEPVKTD